MASNTIHAISASSGLLLCLVTLAGCGSGDDPLAERVYVGTIRRDEVIGSWMPRSSPPTLLQSLLRRGRASRSESLFLDETDTCALSKDLAQRFIDCESAAIISEEANAACVWRIEGPAEEQALRIVFQGPDGAWRITRFSVFRHTTNRDIALLGTCGMGDVYGLFPQAPSNG